MPALPERLLGRHRYGPLLVLVATTIVFALAAPDAGWSHAVLALVQGATLLLALLTSNLPGARLRVAAAVASVAAIAAAVAGFAGGDEGVGISRVLSGLMVLAVPVVIARGVVRHIRDERAVTIHSVFGVLAIYLLVGVAFAFADGAVDRLGAHDFLRGEPAASAADSLYFSLATLTTTGYGDLVPGSDLARSFAILEALTGQIYLVTVVALLVANLAQRRR
jgi:hypothetical protein